MSQRPLSVDETILSLLLEREVLASADLASALAIHERSVRRHLRRLIRGGYVFSPEHGRYRITAAGVAVMAPIETPPSQGESRPRNRLFPRRNGPE
jgi:predicted ArsR family transcriptional regulator